MKYFCGLCIDVYYYTNNVKISAVKIDIFCKYIVKGKGKDLPQQAELAQGVPCWLKPRIFLTFGTTRVVGHQPYAPAVFTPGEIPGTHFFRG
jgi:hypothetical protein